MIVKFNIRYFCLLLLRCLLSGQDQANEHQRGRDVGELEELEEDERVHEQIRQFLSALHLSCGTTSTNVPDLPLAHGQVTLSRLKAGLRRTLVQLFCSCVSYIRKRRIKTLLKSRVLICTVFAGVHVINK